MWSIFLKHSDQFATTKKKLINFTNSKEL